MFRWMRNIFVVVFNALCNSDVCFHCIQCYCIVISLEQFQHFTAEEDTSSITSLQCIVVTYIRHTVHIKIECTYRQYFPSGTRGHCCHPSLSGSTVPTGVRSAGLYISEQVGLRGSDPWHNTIITCYHTSSRGPSVYSHQLQNDQGLGRVGD